MKEKKNTKTLLLVGLLVAIIIGLVLFIIFGKPNDKTTTDKVNGMTNVKSEFNISLEEQYNDILEQYFGIEALNLYDYTSLARYPTAYQDTMVEIMGYVEKVLEEKDGNYKILVSFLDPYVDEEQYLVIEGQYGHVRYLKNDFILIYGVYKGNDTYNINGANEVLPKINTVKIVVGNATGEFDEFSEDELREVADAFFGTTYTLTKPNYECSKSNKLGCYLMGLPFHYNVRVDNNSNARFNNYRLYPSGGVIDVATEQDNVDLKRFISKSSDGNNFILSTYTKSNDYLELQAYDKDFKLIWSRNFEDAGNYLYDNNNGRIALSIDNELYFIDEATGKDVIQPIMTTKGSSIKLLSNHDVILVAQSAKDFIMYIKADGQISWKTSLSTYNGEASNKIDGIYSILVANGKIYIGFKEHSSYAVAVFDQTGKEIVNTNANPNR